MFKIFGIVIFIFSLLLFIVSNIAYANSLMLREDDMRLMIGIISSLFGACLGFFLMRLERKKLLTNKIIKE